MTDKSPPPESAKKQPDVRHPGMMGDGTEEQDLDQPGKPGARITQDEVDEAFAQQPGEPPKKDDGKPGTS